ncbi:hypothetical protein B0J14DRAFT_237924 [Halenospora varia]|nr:hypothetical protein B0J14DRAFT_237924 [Halenospora varia]
MSPQALVNVPQRAALPQPVTEVETPKTKDRLKRMKAVTGPPLSRARDFFKHAIEGPRSPDSPQRLTKPDGRTTSRRQSFDVPRATTQVKRTLSINSNTGEYIQTERDGTFYTNKGPHPTNTYPNSANAGNKQLTRKGLPVAVEMLPNNLRKELPPVCRLDSPTIGTGQTRLESDEPLSHHDIISQLQLQLREARQENEHIRVEARSVREQADETWKRKVDELNDQMMEYRLETDRDHAEILRRNQEVKDLKSQLLTLNGLYKPEVHRELKQFADQNHELNAEILRIKGESDVLARERDRLRAEVDRFVRQIASEAAPVDLYHFDDAYFIKQFNILRGDVKQWAHRGFSMDTPRVHVPKGIEQRFVSMTPHWMEYMTSNEHRPSFVQAFVWNHLLCSVFDRRVWEKNGDYSSGVLEEYWSSAGNQPVNMELCHAWRSTGARLAAQSGTEPKTIEQKGSVRMSRVVDTIYDSVRGWSTMGETQSCAMLKEVVRSAVMLDLQMQQQKAYFDLHGGQRLDKNAGQTSSSMPGTIEYNAKCMDVRYGKIRSNRPPSVVLFITPILERVGSPDGRAFHGRLLLEKSEVDVEPPKKRGGKPW